MARQSTLFAPRSVHADADGPRSEPVPPTAVVVAGDGETRVLLRGLLKLHRFRVLGEADGSSDGDELVRRHLPSLLVVDATLVEGTLGGLIRSARARSSRTRIVLIRPNGRLPPLEADTAPDSTLIRPFRVQEFLEAVGNPPPPAPATDR